MAGFRGGLIFWADLVGAHKIVAKLNALASMVGGLTGEEGRGDKLVGKKKDGLQCQGFC